MSGAGDPPDPDLDREERLDRVTTEYLEAMHAGRAIDREALLEANPDIADELASFLADVEVLDRAISPLRALAVDVTATPDRIGSYEVLGEIARGGMGVVYRAKDPDLGRIVALKTILGGHMASAEAVRRFEREARASAALDHPHIVPIYEVGSASGCHFYVMRYLGGGNLATLAASGLQEVTAARLVATVARAVQFAHERGVLHRDLKPANVLLDEDGAPHVADFGLAAFLDSDSGLTRSGEALGSPSYMAPEQAAGRKTDVSARSDVYSLGAILYELITGRAPFRGDSTIEILRKVVDDPPAPPRAVCPGSSRDLETICLKCLEKDPTRRFASAALLAEELERFVDGRSIITRKPSAPERLWRWTNRNRLASGVIALLAAALFVSGTFAALWRDEVERTREASRERLLVQARLRRTSPQIGRGTLARRDVEEAAAIRRGTDARNEWLAVAARADLVRHVCAVKLPDDVRTAAFDESYLRIAYQDADGVILLAPIDGSRGPARLTRWDHEAAHIAFSSDGRWLAAGTGGAVDAAPVLLLDLSRPPPGNAATLSPSLHSAFTFTHDSSSLLIGRPAGELLVVDTATRSVERRLACLPRPSHLWRKGELVAIGDENGHFQIIDLSTGEPSDVWRATSGIQQVLGVAWHPNGDELAICGDGGLTVEIRDRRDGTIRSTISGFHNAVSEIEFSADGEYLATGDWNGMLRLFSVTTREVEVETAVPRFELRLSGDGRTIGHCRSPSEVSTWRVATPEGFDALPGTASFSSSVAFHPRSDVLAAVGKGGLLLWDLGAQLKIGTVAIGELRSVWFTASGDALAACGAAGVVAYRVTRESTGSGEELRLTRAIHRPADGWSALERGAIGRDWSLAAGHLAIDFTNQARSYVALVDIAHQDEQLRIVANRSSDRIAMSPDGRLVASAPHLGDAVVVWDFASGEEVARFPTGGAIVAFSSSGEKLYVGTYERRFTVYSTADWSPLLTLPDEAPEALAESPDGSLLAKVRAPDHIALVDPETHEDIAVLTSPTPAFPHTLQWSDDGRLLAALDQRYGIRVWRLDRLRRGLAEIGLDWSGRSASPRAGAAAENPPRRRALDLVIED